MDYVTLKNFFEEFIRLGEIHKVQIEIEKMNTADVPRELKTDFADIARRVRSENWGLRLLRPIVRAEPPVIPKATDLELCTYAGLLIKAGALPEAKTLLEKLNPEKTKNVLTFLSQINIMQWNYQDAAVQLKKLTQQHGLPPYQKCIAQVNLAGALLFLNKFNEAKKLLLKILKNCTENKWDLLYGNALEISAQLAVIQNDWPEADRLLNEASNRAGQHSHYLVLVEKWRALAELFQTKPNNCDDAMLKIETVRKKSESLNSWETVRDLDYHVALYLNHQNLLMNVYFGTPHVQYKNRIAKMCKIKGWRIPNHYLRRMHHGIATRILDLSTGQENNAPLVEPLKPGQMLYRLINILAMDLYKPIGLGELFSRLYADEYFNPDGSADRVAQAVKQLRQWFTVNSIPLEIKVENNRYSFQALGPYAFKISKKAASPLELADVGFELHLKQLKLKWPYQSFSAVKAAAELKKSVSSVQAILKKAFIEKKIYKSGAGRSVLYRFQR